MTKAKILWIYLAIVIAASVFPGSRYLQHYTFQKAMKEALIDFVKPHCERTITDIQIEVRDHFIGPGASWKAVSPADLAAEGEIHKEISMSSISACNQTLNGEYVLTKDHRFIEYAPGYRPYFYKPITLGDRLISAVLILLGLISLVVFSIILVIRLYLHKRRRK